MKPYKRILFLSVFITAILIFWLMPRINLATEMDYKLINRKPQKAKLIKFMSGDTVGRQVNKKVIYTNKTEKKNETMVKYPAQKKEYNRDKVNPKFKLNSKMYGRGMRFIEEDLPIDSTEDTGGDTTAVKVL